MEEKGEGKTGGRINIGCPMLAGTITKILRRVKTP
jgi:hypothetical protein